MLILALAACGPDDASFPDGGGGEYTGGCELEGYEPVTDTSAVMDGFTFTVDDVAEAMLGDWIGELNVIESGDAEDATLTFGEPAAIQAWYYSDGSADGGDCTPAYMVELAVTLDTDDEALDGDTWSPVQIVADSLDGVSFEADLAMADIAGTAAPSSFDAEDYEDVWLTMTATFTDAAWGGSLDFAASTPDDADTGDTGDTGASDDTGDKGDTGDTGSGGEKAEASASYGSFSFTR